MNKFPQLIALIFLVTFLSCEKDKANLFTTSTFQINISEQGFVTALDDKETGKNYVPNGNKSPLIAIVENGQFKKPASFGPVAENYKLKFEQSTLELTLAIGENPSHLSLKITGAQGDEQLEAVIWGPYSNTIKDTIGENIGVVRNADFAIGIQSLNPKTTAGKLDNLQGIVSYHGTAAATLKYVLPLHHVTHSQTFQADSRSPPVELPRSPPVSGVACHRQFAAVLSRSHCHQYRQRWSGWRQ